MLGHPCRAMRVEMIKQTTAHKKAAMRWFVKRQLGKATDKMYCIEC